MSSETVTIRLTPQEIARVDEMRSAGMSRSAFVRELLRRAGPVDEPPTYSEGLRLLAESARAGRVSAQIALEKALRSVPDSDGSDWVDQLLGEGEGRNQ